MIVKSTGIILFFVLNIILSTAASPASADNGADPNQAQVIGVVPLTKSGVTQNVYRNIDRIVPELKKIPSERIIKLECSYNGLPEREKDVLHAYQIAARVEKYLREHHKLNIDLWINAHIGKQTRQNQPSLIFSILSGDVKNIGKVPVAPAVSSAE